MPSASPKIALCLVLYKSLDELPELLQNLGELERGPDRMVICVNGPDDGSLAFIRQKVPAATVLERPDNPGFAGGMNLCLAAAEGCDYVLLLNPDVRLAPNYLAQLLHSLEADPQAAGAQGLLLAPNLAGEPERIDSAGFVAQPWLRIVDRGAGSRDLKTFSDRESLVGICAAAALFRRDAMIAVAEAGQVFDEDFWMYKEDQDLCLRLRAAGWHLIFEPQARAQHARGFQYGGRRRVPGELRRHSLKNRYLLLMKHWRWRQQFWTLPVVLVFEVVIAVALLLREPATMKAYLMAWRLRARMFAKRRALLEREAGRDQKLAWPKSAWVMTR